jgi:adenylate/guanylate cyclase family protein
LRVPASPVVERISFAEAFGRRKFVYDAWGHTVNVASRLETSAEPNLIHVSEVKKLFAGSSNSICSRGSGLAAV